MYDYFLKLIIKLVFIFFRIIVAVDHSANLVGIADPLSDLPFGWFIVFHSCLQHLRVVDRWAV